MDVQELPLVGEHPILDFINTVDDPGTASEVDYLPDYEQWALICRRVGLITAKGHEDLLGQVSQHPIVARKAYQEAITLRDNLRALFLSMLAANGRHRPVVKQLNTLLDEAFNHRRLTTQDTRTMAWQWKAGSPVLRIPLWEIALRTADLLCDEARMCRLKVCANDPCQWLFLDYSRNGQRRWCSMAECGNVSKVRRLRARRRSKRSEKQENK